MLGIKSASRKDPAMTQIPSWLSSTDRSFGPHSPFQPETRQHLLARGAQDPRVFELVARIQAKSSGEGSLEREWARKICSGDLQAFSTLSQEFPDPQNLHDVLQLAAYRSDYSYAYFFQNYAGQKDAAKIATFDNITRLIAPTICELQPKVAIGFVGYITAAYERAGQPEKGIELFIELAKANPLQVQFQRARFADIAGGERILQAAKESDQTPRNEVEAGLLKSMQLQERMAAVTGVTR